MPRRLRRPRLDGRDRRHDFDGYLSEVQQKNAGKPVNQSASSARRNAQPQRPVDLEEITPPPAPN